MDPKADNGRNSTNEDTTVSQSRMISEAQVDHTSDLTEQDQLEDLQETVRHE